MNNHSTREFTIPPGDYIPGMFRGDNGENMVTHLYKGTFADPGLPMCKRGWQYGDSYSIFRNNISKKGICKICLRRAYAGLDGVACPENQTQSVMTSPLLFSDLDQAQCHVIFNMAFADYTVYDNDDQPEPTVQADESILSLYTDHYMLTVKRSGEVSGGRDRSDDSSIYAPCEVDGTQVRKMLRQYNVNIYTETEFIDWLRTQRNYDTSPGDNFFGTFMMGPWHFATVFRKTEAEPYTYIIHGESHPPNNESIRTTDFERFLSALDKISAMSEDAQFQKFAEL